MDEGVEGTGKVGEGRECRGHMEGGWVLGEADGWDSCREKRPRWMDAWKRKVEREGEMGRGGEAEGIEVWMKRWRELGRWGKRKGGCREENMESRWVRPRTGISIEWEGG